MNKLTQMAFLTFVLFVSAQPAEAATTSPKPAVQGTIPFAGMDALPSQTYTLGKSHPLNFTLLRAELSVSREVTGQTVLAPQANQKLLVLTSRVAHPQKKDTCFNSQSLTFTAMDAQNTN